MSDQNRAEANNNRTGAEAARVLLNVARFKLGEDKGARVEYHDPFQNARPCWDHSGEVAIGLLGGPTDQIQ